MRRAAVRVLQISDVQRVQFLTVTGETALNSEHKHLKHALHQHKFSEAFPPSLQKQELGSECQNTEGHHPFVISTKNQRRQTLPHPAQANAGTEGWLKDP